MPVVRLKHDRPQIGVRKDEADRVSASGQRLPADLEIEGDVGLHRVVTGLRLRADASEQHEQTQRGDGSQCLLSHDGLLNSSYCMAVLLAAGLDFYVLTFAATCAALRPFGKLLASLLPVNAPPPDKFPHTGEKFCGRIFQYIKLITIERCTCGQAPHSACRAVCV